MKFFKQLILTFENSIEPKLKPQVMNESGTVWIIGYNHVIYGDYEYEQLKEGINQEKADQLLEKDIEQYLITLEPEFNEIYGNQKFSQLNLGCQYLLLSLYYTTGRYYQYSKLIEHCQKNQLCDALKFNNRKCLISEQQQRQFQKYALEERRFFEQHFDFKGIPKNQNDWKQQILQSTEDDLDYANQYVLSRYQNFQQYCIFAEINDYQFCNYKDPKWMEFVRDQEGQKYNYVSYNQEKQKWFPVEVQDQERLIIGFSHVCTVEEEKYFKEGLTEGQVNYLFLSDYDNNVIRVKRYLRQEFPQHKFEGLQSWIQLFLIDISFRNYTFDAYQEAIKLALEGKQQEAIAQSNIDYPPSASVNTHYQERVEKINDIFNQVQSNYSFIENQNNSAEKLFALNNIVGIKITEGGYKFILNDQAQTKVNFKDLLTFLRVYYDPEFADAEFDIYFSLDPDDNQMQGEYQKKVYFPEYLEGTEVGEVLYQSDFILKQMSLGIRSNGNGQQVENFDYGGLNIQPIYVRDPDFFNRIFLKIGNMKLNYVEDQSNNVHSLTIEHIDVTVDARTQGDDGEEHIIDDPNNAAQIFVDQFVQNYDQISQRYPVFQRLKEVLMANYLAKHMKRKNAQLNFESLDKLYQQTLINNYKQYKSPNLSMQFQLPDGFVEVTGGVDGIGIDITEKANAMLQQIETLKVYFVESENKQNTEINLSRCSSVDSIQSVGTEASIEDITERRKCKCEKDIDTEGDLCKHCLKQQKCTKCQKVISVGQQLQINNKIYCKDCIKCSQCNKQNPENDIKIIGSYFTHNSCSQIQQKESQLKKGILELIRKQLKTIDHEAKAKPAENYFTCQKFECVEFKNYLDYVVGYHHFLVKDKIQLDFKNYKVLKTKAESNLIEDFQNAEDKVVKLIIENGKKISDINENVLMLFISAAFIFREEYLIKPLLTSAASNNYNNLYFDLQEFKCKQIKKHNCSIKSKLKFILDLFNDKFHREDGRARQKIPVVSYIQKSLPSTRR